MILDGVFAGFLRRQLTDGVALASESDLVEVHPMGPAASHLVLPQAFEVILRCNGLVRSVPGEIATADRFAVGVWFPSDYLRRAYPFEVVTWLGPREIFHPNIRAPFICIGHLVPATPLVEIIHRVFRIVSYQVVAMHDALNQDASAWARQNQHRLPVDGRPLKRRTQSLKIETLGKKRNDSAHEEESPRGN